MWFRLLTEILALTKDVYDMIYDILCDAIRYDIRYDRI